METKVEGVLRYEILISPINLYSRLNILRNLQTLLINKVCIHCLLTLELLNLSDYLLPLRSSNFFNSGGTL